MAVARTSTDYVSSHFVRFFARLILAVNSMWTGDNTRNKRGEVAPHSADTETSRRRQLPYNLVRDQIYVTFFSTNTRAMEKTYFRNTFNYWFKKRNFRVYVSVIKCLFSFDEGHVYSKWPRNAQNRIVFSEV